MLYLKYIDNLPEDIVKIIFNYIKHSELIWLNNYYYKLYHHKISFTLKLRKNYNEDSYLRNLIKKDYYYVFGENIKEKIDKWIIEKKYIYKTLMFKNYLSFLINYCIDKGSTKCKNVLLSIMKKKNMYDKLKNKELYKLINL